MPLPMKRIRWLNQQYNLNAIVAAVLSLLGALLLGLSFEATSANLTVVTGQRLESESQLFLTPFVALCIGGTNVLMKYDAPGDPLAGGACPAGEKHPVAEVTRESRTLFILGWLMVIVGAIWQMFLSSRPRLLLR